MEIDKRSNLEHYVGQVCHTGNNYSVIHHQQISYQNHLRSISSSVSVSV